MEVIEAIRTRRSIGKVKPDSIDKKLIEEMLESAIWAPNHYHTEPWRFIVMVGEGRRVLGRAYAEIAAESADALSPEELELLRNKNEQKALRAPAIIAVAVTPEHDKSKTEEIAAVHAAIQNMLLTAHALGLGAIWRTGEPAYHPKMLKALGLNEAEHIAGFIYVGYPDMATPKSKRTPYQEKTEWINN
jgi:nitroreductase